MPTPNPFDQSHFDVRCEWGIAGIERLAPSEVIVIVDVLSFTTAVEVALSRGTTILPYRWADDSAAEYARSRKAELAGPRDNREGKFTLSPLSLVEAPRGLRLVLPSPNGATLAFEAANQQAIVLAGCLRNASAVAARASQLASRITVVPAGERWQDGSLRPAVEDLIGAGAIIRLLPGSRSPEAQMAVAVYESLGGNLRNSLFACSSGRELAERGFGQDVVLAAEFDVSSLVPRLEKDEFVPDKGLARSEEEARRRAWRAS